jgi:hypothetical protein
MSEQVISSPVPHPTYLSSILEPSSIFSAYPFAH